MKITIAIDSFKGSLSSIEAGSAASLGIKRVLPSADITILPIADGGEGTVNALVSGLGGKLQHAIVTGPIGDKIDATYGIINDTAIIEMAEAAGLNLVPSNKRNPMYTTTYGLGELIKDAYENGCTKYIIGIGGSATNDGGAGMLQALGFKLTDANNDDISYGASGLSVLHNISDSEVPAYLKECQFDVACDVTNPLFGPNGCSMIFAPQKGASNEEILLMDSYMKSYSDICKKYNPSANPDIPGSGAAGGLGFAFNTFLNATLKAGTQIVFDAVNLEKHISNSDIVITGEGRIDSQTIMGKAPIAIASLAHKYNKNVIAFCGCASLDASICNDHGIDAIFPILRNPCSIEEALDKETASRNLSETACQVFRLISTM